MKQQVTIFTVFGVIILAGAFMPAILKQYHLYMLTEIIVFSLFAVSYNLLLGYAGLLSFGHALFFGVSAFVTALAIIHLPGLSILSAVLIGFVASIIVGCIIGGLLLRHKGSYFALLTLAFSALFYAVAVKWYSVTGGDNGLNITRPDLNLGFTSIPMASLESFYYLTLIIVGSTIAFCWYFTTTAMGKTVLLMRENEDRMQFLGYNTNITRLILFTFTGALAGLAGSFYALHFEFVSHTAVSINMTTVVLLMTFVGGTKKFWGPILGVFVYIIFQNYLSDLTDRWALIMGFIFVFMVLFVPGGLSEVIMKIQQRLFGKKNNNSINYITSEEETL
jgi:branched-chain amino acid transport system permease protein